MHGIVAFAFGAPETILPNVEVRRIALELARILDLPIFTQQDIAAASGVDMTYTDVARGEARSTWRMAQAAVRTRP